MVNILNSLYLAKLACLSVQNECLLRYHTVRKVVQRVRRLMATVAWDTKLTQWLHQLLMDHLDSNHLACYLDILQVKTFFVVFLTIMSIFHFLGIKV